MRASERWAFLRPWCRLLRGRLRLGGRVAEHSARWEYRWVAVRLPCALELASLDELQRLHEALDLLARVAHVDNAAYRALLVDECRVPRQDDDAPLDRELPARFRFVFNEKFLAPGALSPAEACERYFVDAHQLPATEAYTEALSGLLRESGAVQTQSDGCESVDAASIQFDLQLEFVALSDEVLGTLLQGIFVALKAGKVVQATTRRSKLLPYKLDAVELDIGPTNAPWSLASALSSGLHARIPLSELAFSLKSTNTTQAREDRQSMAYFLRTVLCGDAPAGTGATGIRSVSVGCHDCDQWRFAALCSAISAASSTSTLRLHGVFLSSDSTALRRWKWRWLVYALFSEAARSSISTVFVAAARLTREDIAAMADTLASNSPPTAIFQEPSMPSITATSDKPRGGLYGYFSKGTLLHVLEDHLNRSDFKWNQPSIPLVQASWLQILSDDRDAHELSVLVPGYGVVRVDRSCASQIQGRLPVAAQDQIYTQRRSPGLSSLSLALGRHSNYDEGDVLTDFLELVGRPLQSLTVHSAGSYPTSFTAIRQRCPQLTELFLDGVELVGADSLARDLSHRDSKITRLGLVDAFTGRHQITRLAEAIGQGAGRLSGQLTELCLAGSELSCLVDDTNVRALLAMLEGNKTLSYLRLSAKPWLHGKYKAAFDDHCGERLPVLQEKLPLSSKLAFLSVCRGCDVAIDAASQLSDEVLRLVFKFAATCVTRAVVFQCDD